jgi:hypothetical protein
MNEKGPRTGANRQVSAPTGPQRVVGSGANRSIPSPTGPQRVVREPSGVHRLVREPSGTQKTGSSTGAQRQIPSPTGPQRVVREQSGLHRQVRDPSGANRTVTPATGSQRTVSGTGPNRTVPATGANRVVPASGAQPIVASPRPEEGRRGRLLVVTGIGALLLAVGLLAGLQLQHAAHAPTPVEVAAAVPTVAVPEGPSVPRRDEAARLAGSPENATMVQTLYDPKPSVSAVAAEGLVAQFKSGRVPVESVMAAAVDKTLPFRTRLLLIDGIGQVPSPTALTFLDKLLHNGDEHERGVAALVLRNQMPDKAVPLIMSALGDQSRWVQQQAQSNLRFLSRGQDFGTDADKWRAWFADHPIGPPAPTPPAR